MVTAIVIPIICLYFFWLTKKEMNENETKWRNLSTIREEAIVTGRVKTISEERQRYYYHRYIYVQELLIQTDSNAIRVKKITPLTKDCKIEPFQAGDDYIFYGQWNEGHFLCNRYMQSGARNEIHKSKKEASH